MISLHYDDVSIAIAVLCMLDTQTDILQFSRSSLCTVYIRATYDALFRTYIAHRKDGIIIRISLNNGIILGSADPKGLSKTGFRITYLPFMRVFETFLLHSSSNLNFQKHGLRCLKKGIQRSENLKTDDYSRVWNRRRAGNNHRAWKICQKE